METLLIVFISVTAVAVVLQTAMLMALYARFRKSSARMEALAAEVHTRAIPTLEAAQTMLVECRPRVDHILDNLVSASTTVKEQVSSLDATVTEVVERTRLQVARVDELMTSTLDRVEDATELVHHSVISPVRRASGVLQGLTAGLAALLGRTGNGRPRRPFGTPKDDMFI